MAFRRPALPLSRAPGVQTDLPWPHLVGRAAGIVTVHSQLLRVCPCQIGKSVPPSRSCSTSKRRWSKCLIRNRRFRRVLESPLARSSLWPDRRHLAFRDDLVALRAMTASKATKSERVASGRPFLFWPRPACSSPGRRGACARPRRAGRDSIREFDSILGSRPATRGSQTIR